LTQRDPDKRGQYSRKRALVGNRANSQYL
jgi:hypothetical protein